MKEIKIEDLKVIRDEYFGKEELKNYVAVNLILLNYLLESKKFSEAKDELNKLQFIQVCEKNNVPKLLVSKLLHTEFDSQGMTKHSKVFAKIGKILSEEWRGIEQLDEIKKELKIKKEKKRK